MEWSVNIEIEAAVDEDRIDQLTQELQDASPAVATADNRLAVRLWIEAPTAIDAIHQAHALVSRKIDGPIVDVQATEWTRFEADLERSPIPELVGAAEAEAMLGISRQRFHQIRKTHAFPAPLTDVAATPIWTRQSIEEFLRTWNRTPGRPGAAKAATAPTGARIIRPVTQKTVRDRRVGRKVAAKKAAKKASVR